MNYQLFNFGSGSFASVFGVGVYGDHSDAWWHRAFIMPVFRVGHRVREAVWAVRYRCDPRHRYHMIDTHLAPGYRDVDQLMLHGMFSLLRRYVEDEMGGAEEIVKFNEELRSRPDPNEPEGLSSAQADWQAEAVALYQWWMVDHPAMMRRQDALMEEAYSDRRPIYDTVPIEGNPHLSQIVFRPVPEHVAAKRGEIDALEQKIEREEQEMLHRLVDIRRSLWT